VRLWNFLLVGLGIVALSVNLWFQSHYEESFYSSPFAKTLMEFREWNQKTGRLLEEGETILSMHGGDNPTPNMASYFVYPTIVKQPKMTFGPKPENSAHDLATFKQYLRDRKCSKILLLWPPKEITRFLPIDLEREVIHLIGKMKDGSLVLHRYPPTEHLLVLPGDN